MIKINKIAVNISWLSLEKTIRIITFFFVGAYVIRYLGPENFGVLSLILTFLSIFSIFSSWGLRGLIVKKLSEKNADINKIIYNGFATSFFLSILFLLLFIFFSYFYSKGMKGDIFVFFLISSFSLIFTFNEIIAAFFESKINIKPIMIIMTIVNIVISLIKIAFLFAGSSLINFVILIPVESFLISICSIYVISKKIDNFQSVWIDKKIIKNYLYLGFPLALASFVNILNMRIDQIMIANVLDLSSLGQYSVAVRMSELFFIIPTALTASYFPILVKADMSKEKNIIKQMTGLLSMYSVVTFLFIFIFGEFAISFLFGDAYQISDSILKVLILSTFFISLSLVNGKWLLKYEKTKLIFIRVLISSIVNVFLNYYLLRAYGLHGAAYATVISYFVLFILILIDKDGWDIFRYQLESLKPINLIQYLKTLVKVRF
jgi:O-antigen/teichoic acid export membrane protein